MRLVTMSEDKNNTPQKQTPPPQDERNIVTLTDADAATGIEDRLWLFWQRNRGGILLGIVAAFVAVLGMEGFEYMRQQERQTEQQAYLEAIQNGTGDLFVIDYPKSPLSGLIWLEQADEAYTEKDYALAAERYQKANTALEQLPLGTRARIGYGLSLYKQDNIPAARNTLASVTTDPMALDTLRAEANYHLAVIALERSEPARAVQHLDAISALGYTGNWSTRAEVLRLNAPELNRAETVTEIKPATEQGS